MGNPQILCFKDKVWGFFYILTMIKILDKNFFLSLLIASTFVLFPNINKAEEQNPLIIKITQSHYWIEIGDTVKFKVLWKQSPLPNQEVFLNSPNGKILSFKTDKKGIVSCLIPEVERKLFAHRYAHIAFTVWTEKTDETTKTKYVASQTIKVHPERYGGAYWKDAQLLVIITTIIFSAAFLFIKRKIERT